MDHDTEVIVKDFNSILEELTFNSRPIITTLTKLAEENISCAQYFVDAIESRIEKCMPKQKLYAFMPWTPFVRMLAAHTQSTSVEICLTCTKEHTYWWTTPQEQNSSICLSFG